MGVISQPFCLATIIFEIKFYYSVEETKVRKKYENERYRGYIFSKILLPQS